MSDSELIATTQASIAGAAPAIVLRRVDPVPGLMIDSSVWRDAHEFHAAQARLHHLAVHGWGIATGLEVSAVDGQNALRVAPGVGVAADGRFIVVPRLQVVPIASRGAGPLYLVVREQDVPAPAHRIDESFQILQRDLPPGDVELELARVQYDPGLAPIRSARDAAAPGRNELDLRWRRYLQRHAEPLDGLQPGAYPSPPPLDLSPVWQQLQALDEQLQQLAGAAGQHTSPSPQSTGERVDQFEAALATLSAQFAELGKRLDSMGSQPRAAEPKETLRIGLLRHSAAGWDNHRDGLKRLSVETAAVLGRRTEMYPNNNQTELSACDVVYVSGYGELSLTATDVDGLARVLDRGGTVIGDGCAAGPAGEQGARQFAFSFEALGRQLGRRLSRVERGVRLLTARYMFGEPPALRRERVSVLEDNGMLCTDADYGCAWQAGPPGLALPRSDVRDALEFGMNLVTYRSKQS